jgi:hypothetical protein
MSDEEFTLSELDTEVFKFLEENKDLEFRIVIEFVEDLGIKVELVSEGSVGRSGDALSVTNAVLKLLAKAVVSTEEYRRLKAEVDAEDE